jgi:hypothetical protein
LGNRRRRSYFFELPKDAQAKFVGVMMDSWLRLERQVESRGLVSEELVAEDYKESEKRALKTLRGGD